MRRPGCGHQPPGSRRGRWVSAMRGMSRRLRCLVLALLAAGGSFVGVVNDAHAATPAYVTPMMAHTAWTATENCRAVSGVVTLPNVLSGHSGRGMSLTGSTVTGWVYETQRRCIEGLALSPFPKPIRMPSWADLTSL